MVKNIEQLKQITRSAFFREMIEKTKTATLIWKEISPGHYKAEYSPYEFYISQPFPSTYILDIIKDEQLYKSYNSNFNSILLNLFREVDYFLIQEKLEKHRTLSNVVNLAVPIGAPEVKLFDENSWQGIVPEPYSTYLDAGKRRWESFVKYNPDVVDIIQLLIPTWKGLAMNSYTPFYSNTSSTIAACGVVNYIDLITNAPGLQFNSLTFNLFVNTYFESIYTDADWVNIITHEMGHALGIGIFWNPFFYDQGAIPPSNSFLSSAYFNTQNAYNQLTGLSRDRVPLESTGGAGTNSAHWENSYRPSDAPGTGGSNFYGFLNELMIGYYSEGMNSVISDQSIKHLVDLGYMEKNPGLNEGDPMLVSGLSFAPFLGKKLECSVDFSQMVKVGTADLRK